MFKVLTLNNIAPIGLERFPRDLYEISSETQHPDAILVRSHVMHDIPIPSSVKVVGRAGAGLNNIPVDALTKKGIAVFNTPGANANAVRELVIAGMLLASRNLMQAMEYVKQLAISDDLHKIIEKNKKQFVGFELAGKTLGVIGLGSIGVKVANAALHLGMNVIGYDPQITVNRAWELSSSVQQASSIDELLMQSDFVTCHVPLNDATKHMLNASRLQRLKPNATLLNFARESIVDHTALLQVLNDNKIFAYVTDFPNLLIKDHPRVINLPHLGASTKEAEENCAIMIADQVRNFLERGSVVNAVNLPMVDVPVLTGESRLAIVNANVPNMVAQISSKLANGGLNIVSLLNQSRNDIAYTVIDLSEKITDAVLKEIRSIEGILQVRVIKAK